jgi:hypothetical protein
MRFGADSGWGHPEQNYEMQTGPQWDKRGWWWSKKDTFPVEQQAPKLNYQSVAKAWLR